MDQYDFTQSDVGKIKSEIAERLKLKDGKLSFDGKKIIITMKGEPGKTPEKGKDYKDGEPGVSPPGPEHQWDGTKLRVQNPDGTWGPWCELKGEKGEGEPGKTPVKGVDYRDGEDGDPGDPGVEPEEMAAIRTELRLTGEWVKRTTERLVEMNERLANMDERLANVKDGYTPVKGKDYDDGEPGKTPVKGKDYKDGEDGKTPVKGEDYKDGEPGEDAKIPESVTIAVLTDVELIDGKLSKKFEHVKIYLGD